METAEALKSKILVKFIGLISIALFIALNSGIYAQKKTTLNNSHKQASSIGEVTVDKWADGRTAAFSFSFDDGFMSQYTYAAPILKKFGFHATYYLIANSLTDGAPAIFRYGYWWQFQQLMNDGNEIGDHTMTHSVLSALPLGDTLTTNTIIYELEHSKEKIEQKIPGSNPITIAYPYGDYGQNTNDPRVVSATSRYYEAARAIGGYVQSSTISGGNSYEFIPGNNWYELKAGNIIFDSVRSAADDQNQLDTYLSLLQNQTIANGNWSIFLAHEVFPFDTIMSDESLKGYYPVSVEWLTTLCQYLKQKSDNNEIWIETIGNITKYVKERESFSYSLISSTSSNIQIIPTDTLNDSIYNYPLTVDVAVPSDWNVVGVQQGKNSYNVVAFPENGINYVRVHVVPDGGKLTLTNGPVNFSLTGTVNYDNNAQTPVSNATLTLYSQNDSTTTVTDANGNYSFGNLPAGTYNLVAAKEDGWKGVNLTDALLVAKYFAGQAVLDSLHFKAADVNNNNVVNSTDALMIAKRYANAIQSFVRTDWIFSSPVSITITNGNVTQNIKGIITGDVNGSY